ncbi:endonuclease/exonuclease/phosphatase [Streptomyces bingchenggensis BCW-1]|uniref:Endonuclease/exonuclease/phosphatase n=1 Tax=Streptomyces bingchenggensis (strain BCW-1) TaxID=749414 RepID=D7CBA2_STRBB|nr:MULTISPECIES: endonuclease/exonuclease/phosphatase family protein [Streptomyces]ADI10785.1 endonuclease/exonuclease/phosphatase [Streptomyces bingchenggensis BCW-1]
MSTDQLFLLTPPEAVHEASTDEARLITFNAQHASAERSRRQAEWLAGQEAADLVVMTEVGSGPGGQALVTALAQRGYRSVLALPSGRPDYRTVLASRSAELEAVDSGIGVLSHRGPAARVRIGSHTVGLLGLYVPSRGPKERRNEDKRAFQGAVTDAVPGLLAQFDGPVIVSGDLNVVEPGHVPHHAVFGKWEYSFYRSFVDAGLIDAFRHLHPDAAEHSWFGRGGDGYRFDHAFVTARHGEYVRTCQYLHEPRELGLTDHAAMFLRLGLG